MRRVSKIVTPPATTPISLAEAKAHMGISIADDDTLVTRCINQAVLVCEAKLQRKLITQTWKMWLDYWPTQIKMLFGDLQSVTHVKYTDSDEVQATFGASSYLVDTNSVPGRIVLKSGQSWPSVTLSEVNPIEIQFVTGYGAATAVPDDIKGAVHLTTAHFYENRENLIITDVRALAVEKIPGTAEALLSHYRVWDWIV